MSKRVHTFEFVDPSFMVGSDPVVCVNALGHWRYGGGFRK
jgi:hypothetical protein